MELSGGVKQGKHHDRTLEINLTVALTTWEPNVTVLAHAESPMGAPALRDPH